MEALARITAGAPPLHKAEISRLAVPNRVFAFIYASALLCLFYHHIVIIITPLSYRFVSFPLLVADLVLAFIWATRQSFRIRPLRRRESPEILKKLAKEAENDDHFPAMDVFICTADPYKEPPIGVVNTALSAMAYEYPPEKVSVYVSDDGGSALTLFAFFEAAKFAAHWLPFCRENDVVLRSPAEFFAANDRFLSSEAEKMKTMYESMKKKVESVVERGKVGDEFITGEEEHRAFSKWTDGFTRQDHPTIIQVVLDNSKNRDVTGHHAMPNLIYVSREKSRASIHHFKAGALNVLIRVSATMTNAPIILTLDCDMSSTDPETPLRALCYFSDPKVQSEVAYVQFPQRFRGLNKNDIYSCEHKRMYLINDEGADGLLGPHYLGSCCFFNRRAFFGGPSGFAAQKLPELSPKSAVTKPVQHPEVIELAHRVAARNYESRTQWGYKMGVRYGSLSEDFLTGYHMHCEGWKSVFCNPERAAFYGDAPNSLFDALSQTKRWAVGELQVGLYKLGPLTYGLAAMGPLMASTYAHYSFWPTWSLALLVYSFLPQLALLNGLPIFPKASEPFFIIYLFLFFGAYGEDLLDFLVGGGTVQQWWCSQRMWLIRSLSSFLFGSVDFLLQSLGLAAFTFTVTSKVLDEEQKNLYEQELFEFGIHSPLFVPFTMAAITNLVALIWGIMAVLIGKTEFGEVLMQLLIVAFGVVNSLSIYEAMFFRVKRGGIQIETTLISAILTFFLIGIAFVAFN